MSGLANSMKMLTVITAINDCEPNKKALIGAIFTWQLSSAFREFCRINDRAAHFSVFEEIVLDAQRKWQNPELRTAFDLPEDFVYDNEDGNLSEISGSYLAAEMAELLSQEADNGILQTIEHMVAFLCGLNAQLVLTEEEFLACFDYLELDVHSNLSNIIMEYVSFSRGEIIASEFQQSAISHEFKTILETL